MPTQVVMPQMGESVAEGTIVRWIKKIGDAVERDEPREMRPSPLVRKIAKEHHVDVRNIAGSGGGGRVTKHDILGYIEAGSPVFAPPAFAPQGGATARQAYPAPVAPRAPLAPQEGVERAPMTIMRRRIAEHMVMSRRTPPHVHSVSEVDFTKVDEIRTSHKTDHAKAGGK